MENELKAPFCVWCEQPMYLKNVVFHVNFSFNACVLIDGIGLKKMYTAA